MARVGKVINLFRLPRAKSLAIIADVQPITSGLDLLRKYQRIGRGIEGFCGQNSRTLVAFMIFSDHKIRHPRQDHFRAG